MKVYYAHVVRSLLLQAES